MSPPAPSPSRLLAAVIGLLAASLPAICDTSTPAIRIARFQGDRAAALSYTFDDGLRDQYTVAAPLLDEFGLKGTFFVIPGRVSPNIEDAGRRQNDKRAWGTITWDELRSLAARGHEIASHSWSHPNLTNLPADQVAVQIDQAADAIAREIGRPALTLAFPFNARTPEAEAAALKRHLAFRSHQLGLGGARCTAASLDTWAERQVRDRAWGVAMAHGIASGYSAFTDPEIFRAHLRHVKSRQDALWVDTFANIARYAKERDEAKLAVVSSAPGRVAFTLSAALDPRTYDMPLTVVLEIPAARSVRAERAGLELPARPHAAAIQIDVAPAPEPVTVVWE